MAKILKIDDVQIVDENHKTIQRFLFNDNKIIKINANSGSVITKNASKKYLELIEAYNATNSKHADPYPIASKELEEKKALIQSGEGSGAYSLLGFLCCITFIGAIAAYITSHLFFYNISDKDYLLETDARKINHLKGFYAWACFGNPIIGVVSMVQWKKDMISVLDGKPSRASQNKHLCFKIWWPIILLLGILRIVIELQMGTY